MLQMLPFKWMLGKLLEQKLTEKPRSAQDAIQLKMAGN